MNRSVRFQPVETLLAQIEMRLDVTVWRAGLAETIASAKQAVKSGMIQLNGNPVRLARHRLEPGDRLEITRRIENGLKAKPSYRDELLQRIAISSETRSEPEKASGSLYKRTRLDSLKRRLRAAFIRLLKLRDEIDVKSEADMSKVSAETGELKSPNRVNQKSGSYLAKKPRVSNGSSKTRVSLLKLLSLLKNDSKPKRARFRLANQLHLQVGYSQLALIVLYTPQQIMLPARLDLETIQTRYQL